MSQDGIDVCMLGQMNGVSLMILLDLDFKHPVKLTKIGDFDMLPKAGLEVLNKAEEACGNDAVVDMHCDNCKLILGLVMLVKDCLID